MVESHRALIAAFRTPVVTSTLDGSVLVWNDAAQRLFGQELQAGVPISKVLPFASVPIQAGDFQDLHGVLSPRDESEVEATVLTFPLEEPSSQAAHEAVFIIHHGTHDTILGRMREQLLYNVAHELRGPLSALDGALQALDEDWHELPSEELGYLLASARRTSGRLRILMEDLLSAGSIQAGRFVVEPHEVDLRSIIQESVEAVKLFVDSSRQSLVVGQFSDRVVCADSKYTRQVLLNLLMNASKYSPSGGTIKISIADDGPNHVRISVDDSGKGIPPQQLVGLFERFYRAGDQGGFGLGLAISKTIAEAQGGWMGVESELGRGTCAWLTLRTTRE